MSHEEGIPTIVFYVRHSFIIGINETIAPRASSFSRTIIKNSLKKGPKN